MSKAIEIAERIGDFIAKPITNTRLKLRVREVRKSKKQFEHLRDMTDAELEWRIYGDNLVDWSKF